MKVYSKSFSANEINLFRCICICPHEPICNQFCVWLDFNMTSLKLQLNKLADAHTQWQLTDSENRKRASFLYDPKVASTLDRETIYCLGKPIETT